MMTESPQHLFESDDDGWHPTAACRGPWGDSLHGGAVSALLMHALQAAAGERLLLARLTIDMLRPAPLARLTIRTRAIKQGRRVQLHEALLCHEGNEIAVASALHTEKRPMLGAPIASLACPLPPVPDTPAVPLADASGMPASLRPEGADGLHFRLLAHRISGLLGEGEGAAWLQLPLQLTPGVPLTPVEQLAACADFANGVAQRRIVTPDGSIGCINADLSMHVLCMPEPGPIGIVARTEMDASGGAMVSAEYWQPGGLLARVTQAALVNGY